MLCPKCKIEMRQENSRLTYEGDNSPDTRTIAYMTVDIVCRNKGCDMNGRVQSTKSTPLNIT